MIGLLKNKSQYYMNYFFFLVRDGVQYQEFLLFTQELIHFTQEILPLLPKKLRTPYSRNLRVPTNNSHGELFHVRCGTLVYNTEISHFIFVHQFMSQLSPYTSMSGDAGPVHPQLLLEIVCPSSSWSAWCPLSSVGVPQGGYLRSFVVLKPRHVSSPFPFCCCSPLSYAHPPYL